VFECLRVCVFVFVFVSWCLCSGKLVLVHACVCLCSVWCLFVFFRISYVRVAVFECVCLCVCTPVFAAGVFEFVSLCACAFMLVCVCVCECWAVGFLVRVFESVCIPPLVWVSASVPCVRVCVLSVFLCLSVHLLDCGIECERLCECVRLFAPGCARVCRCVCVSESVLVSLCTQVLLYRWLGAFGCVCLRPYFCVRG